MKLTRSIHTVETPKRLKIYYKNNVGKPEVLMYDLRKLRDGRYESTKDKTVQTKEEWLKFANAVIDGLNRLAP